MKTLVTTAALAFIAIASVAQATHTRTASDAQVKEVIDARLHQLLKQLNAKHQR